jgi:hypothetical protein
MHLDCIIIKTHPCQGYCSKIPQLKEGPLLALNHLNGLGAYNNVFAHIQEPAIKQGMHGALQ